MPSWRRTLYATWIGQFLSMVGFTFVFPFLPFYIRELGVPESHLKLWSGFVTAGTGLTMVFFAPVWGHLADRYGRKIMVLRSMFSGSIIIALLGLAQNAWHVLILRVVQGAFTGTITASLALVSSMVPAERMGFSMGMMQAAVFCGGSVGPLIGGWVVKAVGFRWAFFVGAAFVMAGTATVYLFAEERFVRPPARPADEDRFAPFKRLLATAGFAIALLTLFLLNLSGSILQPVFPLFVEELMGRRDGAEVMTGTIMGVTGIAAALGAAFFGHFADRWGHKRVLLFSMLAGGLLTLPAAYAADTTQLLALRVAFGLGAAGIMPSANAIIRRITDHEHLGKAYGVTASVTCLGWGTGPIIGGALAQAWNLRMPFLLTGVMLILTASLVAWRVTEATNGARPGDRARAAA